jgi:hypothetical protein
MMTLEFFTQSFLDSARTSGLGGPDSLAQTGDFKKFPPMNPPESAGISPESVRTRPELAGIGPD